MENVVEIVIFFSHFSTFIWQARKVPNVSFLAHPSDHLKRFRRWHLRDIIDKIESQNGIMSQSVQIRYLNLNVSSILTYDLKACYMYMVCPLVDCFQKSMVSGSEPSVSMLLAVCVTIPIFRWARQSHQTTVFKCNCRSPDFKKSNRSNKKIWRGSIIG